MKVKEAAIKVLRESGRPLTAEQLAERIVAGGLWQATGKTPAATVSAQLSTDIKKQGDASAFERVAPNTFALRETPDPASSNSPGTTHSGIAVSFVEAAERTPGRSSETATLGTSPCSTA